MTKNYLYYSLKNEYKSLYTIKTMNITTEFRQNNINKLNKKISNLDMSRKIENEIFDMSLTMNNKVDSQIYMSKFISVMRNHKHAKFQKAIEKNKIDKVLCNIHLLSKRNSELKKTFNEKKNNVDILKEGGIKSSIYTCPLCKSKNIFTNVKQFRASDESSTILCECLDCRHNFRG